MKKIALVHYAYPPNLGGVEKVLSDHAVILSEHGYEVSVFTGDGASTNKAITVTEVSEFRSIQNINPKLQEKLLEKGILDEDFYTLSDTILAKLERMMKDQDIVIVHNMLTVYRNLAFTHAFHQYAAQHPEKKIIIWVHDHNFIGDEKIKNIDAVTKSPIIKSLLSTPISHATYVAISETFKDLLIQVMDFQQDQVKVIPNGINVFEFLEIEPRIQAFYNSATLSDAFPILCSPVNIVERKNIEYGLSIVGVLKDIFPNIRYIITGKSSQHRDTSDYIEKIKKQINLLNLEKHVVFFSETVPEALKMSELHDLYSLSDCIFYFSKSENFGLPVVEAMLAKTPIFTSNLTIFREVGGNFIYPIDTDSVMPQVAAEKIHKYLMENEIIQASYHARKNYNLGTILKEKLLPLL